MSRESADALLHAFQQDDDHVDICEQLHLAKTQIKREAVETSAIGIFFHAIRLGLSSDQHQIITQTLSLTHGIVRRLNIQDPTIVRQHVSTILTPLLDAGRRIAGVQGSSGRGALLLRDCISAANQTCAAEVEKALRDTLSVAQPTEVRQFAVAVLERLINDGATSTAPRWMAGILSRTAEDPNDVVRTTARKLLSLLQDRHAQPEAERRSNTRSATRPEHNVGVDGNALTDRTRHLASSQREGSVAGSLASTYLGSVPGSELDHMDGRQVQSTRDLEAELAAMLPSFEGRESEKNWLLRERNVTQLRALLRGNAVNEHLTTFVAGLKNLLDGIVKAMSSLRTSLCLNALQLVKDMAIVLGAAMNALAEQLFAAMVKLTALTKKIAASAANVSICVVLTHCSCWNRLLQHIVLAVSDKNVAPRLYAASWLRYILEAQSEQHALDHQSVESLDKAQRKLLGDANPGVREAARVTFWQFTAQFPDRGDQIINSLEPTARKQLERAGGRPDAAPAPSVQAASLQRARVDSHAEQRHVPPRITTIPAQTAHNAPAQVSVPTSEAITRVGGLSSGSVRPGLGSARRPMPAVANPMTAAAATKSATALSATPASTATALAPSQPNGSPMRQEIERPSPRRRRAIVEQLEHEDWRERVEGVVILACLLAKREPPVHEGLKYTLPAMDVLRPVLRKLMADPQSEVFNHLVAPEVVGEVAKIIAWENILPRMLLLAETDEADQGHDIKSNCLPATKRMFCDEDAVQMCLEILALLKVTGHSGKLPRSVVKFTPTQKRHIIRGVLHWLIELAERHQEAIAAGAAGNSAMAESNEYRLLVNRTMSMMTNIQPSSINYVPLASFLRLLRAIDRTTFERSLSTFERSIVVALRKAWGEQVAEEDLATREEPIAGVEQVLGRDPSSWNDERAPHLSGPTPLQVDEDARSCTSEHSAQDELAVEDEALDLTIVTLPHWDVAPKTPAAVRRAMAEIDSPFSPLKPQRPPGHGKENQTAPGTSIAWPVNTVSKVASVGSEPPPEAALTISRDLTDSLRMHASLEDVAATADAETVRIACAEMLSGTTVQPNSWSVLIHLSKQEPVKVLGLADSWLATGSRSVQESSRMALLLSSIPDDSGQLSQQLVTACARLCLTTESFSGPLQESIRSTMSMACERADPTPTLLALVQQVPQHWLELDASKWSRDLEKLLVMLDGLTILTGRQSDCTVESFKGTIATLVRKGLCEDLRADSVLVAQVRRASVNLALAMHKALGRNSGKVFAALDALQPAQHNLLMYYFEQQ